MVVSIGFLGEGSRLRPRLPPEGQMRGFLPFASFEGRMTTKMWTDDEIVKSL
jgi:hypothetical protein